MEFRLWYFEISFRYLGFFYGDFYIKQFNHTIVGKRKSFRDSDLAHFRPMFPLYILMEWINLLTANPKKWLNTLKQFVGFCRRIVWMCLSILCGWRYATPLVSQKWNRLKGNHTACLDSGFIKWKTQAGESRTSLWLFTCI